MYFFYTPNWIRKSTPDLIWSFFSPDKSVFLTFDDGPNEEITPFILDKMAELDWKATFFCVGENAQRKPHLIERIRREGHQIGNHTFNHLNAWKNRREAYLENVEKADEVLHSSLFRPPYGKLNWQIRKKLSAKYRIILWSFMAYDFDAEISLERIEKEAEKYIKAGDIIVLHDNEKFIEKEKKVFEIIIRVLQKKGLKSKAIAGD